MFTPETSAHFQLWEDPVTGVKNYILKTRVAAQQMGFYFVNSATDDDCRFLWFYCSFPPAMYMTLGVVDFETDEVRHFPHAAWLSQPVVDPDTGDCIFGNEKGFYLLSPKPEKPIRKICPLPPELTRFGPLVDLGSHLTFTPDRKEIFVDARSGDKWVHGTLELETGIFRVWNVFSYCKTHGQVNPVNGDLALCAEDHWTGMRGGWHDMRTNSRGEFERLWLETRNGRKRMIPPLDRLMATHEWWNADGTKVYYCRYGGEEDDIVSYDLKTGKQQVVAPWPAWHAYTSLDSRYLCFDEKDVFFRGTASRVCFGDTVTQKRVYIVSANPAMATKASPSPYELDPHPRFVAKDRYICHTIAVNGYTEVAMCPVAPLIDMTR